MDSIIEYIECCFTEVRNKSTSINFVCVQLCTNHLFKTFVDDVKKYYNINNPKIISYLKFCFKKGMQVETLEEGEIWLSIFLSILYCKQKNDEYNKAKKMLSNIEDEIFPDIIELEFNDLKKDKKNIKNSSFSSYYYPIYEVIRDSRSKINDPAVDCNDFYSPDFAKLFMEKYIPIIPLWSGMIGKIANEKLMPTNACIESEFRRLKYGGLQGRYNQVPSEYIRNVQFMRQGQLNEILLVKSKKVYSQNKQLKRQLDTNPIIPVKTIKKKVKIVSKQSETSKIPADSPEEQNPTDNWFSRAPSSKHLFEFEKRKKNITKADVLERAVKLDYPFNRLYLGTMEKELNSHYFLKYKYLAGEDFKSLNEKTWLTNDVIEKILAIMINDCNKNLSYTVINTTVSTCLIRFRILPQDIPTPSNIWVMPYQLLLGSCQLCDDRCRACGQNKNCKCNPKFCSHRIEHWILIMIDFPNKKFTWLDSLESNPNIKQKANSMCDMLRTLNLSREGWNIYTPQHDVQIDGYNCGIYVCMFFENILKEKELTNLKIKDARCKYKELLLRKLDKSILCIYCSSSQSLVNFCKICAQGICSRCVKHSHNMLSSEVNCEICTYFK